MDETHLYNLTFIGAGNVATHLSQALSQHHCCIRQVFSRTEESARELAGRLHTAFTTRLDEIDAESDLYIVSIKDSALNEVLPALTRRNPDALFVHTAGSVPMSIWNGLARRHGVIYPMQTFSKQRDADFTTTPFFIEANSEEDTHLLMQLAQRLSEKVYEASSEQRKYLHISAVFACNFANHMYAVCHHLLSEHGLPFESMLPLIEETTRKIHYLTPEEAQTGPARRNDCNIMEDHLHMLESEPELAEIYRNISRNIQAYAEKTKKSNP